ncbi:MAG: hypothetical protein M3044_20670 [Thermoproteota archaeon]|nr:hypothetical protein [Thermoproteota archaeon]
MSTAKRDKDTSSTKLTDYDTRKVINQTFDEAKNKARKAIDKETSRVVVNGAKMLEEATYHPNLTAGSNHPIENRA